MIYIRKRMLGWLCAALAALCMAMPDAKATTLIVRTIEELSQRADAVVRATAIDQQSVRKNGAIVTQLTLEVTEKLVGDPPDVLRLWLPGGEIDNLRAHVPGVVRYHLGDDVIVFLEHLDGEDWRSASLSWSIYTCDGEMAYRSSRDVLGLSSSANPLLSKARAVQIEHDHALPIQTLRDRITAIEERP